MGYHEDPDKEDKELSDGVEFASVKRISSIVCVFAATEADIRAASINDKQYKLLLETVKENKFSPSRSTENELIKDYYNVRDRLSIINGLVTHLRLVHLVLSFHGTFANRLLLIFILPIKVRSPYWLE